ncbi:hypothetical protein RIF29_04179 [Crotalaria pallida]|uniref:IBH1-like N-terminal domain-containing protein n=1 Tax=Crotalaria pallida TaxID=3830 RepID=A0AAN9J387_CROPI
MEGQSSKRRRVYSPQPKKVAQAMFTRNYVNYLVPSLMKIKESRSSSEHKNDKHCDFQNVVKHEVDMAMVFSAQGYAWSDALKMKLLRAHHNDNSSTSLVENNGACQHDKGSSRIYPSSKSKQGKVLVNIDKSKCIDMKEKEKVLKGEDNGEEVIINKQLKCLRRLIPGGEEMCNEQMVSELESYISCLQMQVNILQCITQTP